MEDKRNEPEIVDIVRVRRTPGRFPPDKFILAGVLQHRFVGAKPHAESYLPFANRGAGASMKF